MSLEPEQSSSSDPSDEVVPKKKDHSLVSMSFYASVKTWILLNYELRERSFLFNEDLLSHASEDKDVIVCNEGDHLNTLILARAVRELWTKGGVTIKATKSCRLKQGKRKRGFKNLSRKVQSQEIGSSAQAEAFDKEWKSFVSEVNMTFSKSKWQTIVNNEKSVSFVRCENLSFDGQRAVTEVNISKKGEGGDIILELKHHNRIVPTTDLAKLSAQFHSLPIVKKAQFLLSFMENSKFCRGFPVITDREYASIKTSFRTYNMISCEDSTAPGEKRGFSSNCQVFTNCRGNSCFNCRACAQGMKRKEKRHRKRESMHPLCNHRYMTREQMLEKITSEKTNRLKEKEMRENTEADLPKEEQSDHS